MEWIETHIYTSATGIEPVCALIMENGINGMQIQDDAEMKEFIEENPFNWDYVDEELLNKEIGETYIVFYLPKTPSGFEVLNNIKTSINGLKQLDKNNEYGRLSVENKNVDEKDWVDNWKKYYKPFKIGSKIVIKPEWEEYPQADGEIIFNINPGNLFGTGLHQTTQLCIEQIEKNINAQSTVLDLGCGTGVLSIISLLLGAKYAYAADMELNVTEVVTENAVKNNIDLDKYTIRQGNVLTDKKILEEISSKTFNTILVNIVADVIIELSSFVFQNLEKGGLFICSGIISQRIEDVYNALWHQGFKIKDTIQKDDWVCIVSEKE